MSLFISPSATTGFIRAAAVAGFVFLLVICSKSVSVAVEDKNVAAVSVQQVKKMLHEPNVMIIDVRKSRGWWRSSQKILTAVREDPLTVDHWIGKYPEDKLLIFYCA